jgi:hypothetical protein
VGAAPLTASIKPAVNLRPYVLEGKEREKRRREKKEKRQGWGGYKQVCGKEAGFWLGCRAGTVLCSSPASNI